MKKKDIRLEIEREFENRKRKVSLMFCTFYLIMGAIVIYFSINPVQIITLIFGGVFIGYGLRGLLWSLLKWSKIKMKGGRRK